MTPFRPASRSIRRCQQHRGPSRRRGAGDRRGVSAVEFVIAANVMIAAVFICIEFARLNMLRNLTQDAAYFAARAAMVPGATENDAIAEAERILGILNAQGVTVDVNGGEAITDNTKELSVHVTVPIGKNALFVGAFTGDKKIEATATMKTERYDGFYAPK